MEFNIYTLDQKYPQLHMMLITKLHKLEWFKPIKHEIGRKLMEYRGSELSKRIKLEYKLQEQKSEPRIQNWNSPASQ